MTKRLVAVCIISLILSNIAPALPAFAVSPVNEYQWYENDTHGVGPGSVDGLINKSDGSFTYSLPLQTPKGRNGMEPQLALTYQSNNRTTENIVGYGWTLNIPYIERLNKTGVHSLYG